jgi:hypothetical protein
VPGRCRSEALALYDKAAALGLKDLDFVRTHEQASLAGSSGSRGC